MTLSAAITPQIPMPQFSVTEITVQPQELEDNEENKCPVCLDIFNETENISIAFRVYETSCKHRFHAKCIYDWVSTKENCPVCRKDFPRAEIIDISEPFVGDQLSDQLRCQRFHTARTVVSVFLATICLLLVLETIAEGHFIRNISETRYALIPLFGGAGSVLGFWAVIEVAFYKLRRRQIQDLHDRMTVQEV